MELFRLFGSIFIDNDEANKSLSNTEKKAGGLGGTLAKVAGGVAKGGAVMAGGLAVAGGAILGVTGKTAEYADRVDKLSAKTGLSKKGFQEWDYVMGQNGMSIEKMQSGMKTLVQRMDGVQEGNKASIEMFDALGISVKNSDGSLRSQEQVMNDTIMALARMPEGAEKARLATELFGKAGIEMAPMLATGEDGIKSLIDRSHELGLVMSDEAVTSGVVFGDTMDDVKDSLGMVATKVGAELMPIVMQLLDWILLNMPTIQAVFGTVMGVLSTAVQSVGTAIQWVMDNAVPLFNTYLLPVIQAVVAWFQENFPAIKDTVGNVFDSIKTVWEETLKPAFDAIMGIVASVWAVFQEAFPVIKQAVLVAFDAIKLAWNEVLKPAIDKIIEIINRLKEKFDEHMPTIKRIFREVSDSIEWAWKELIKPAIEALGEILSWLWEQFNTYIWPLVSDVIDWFAQISDGVTEKFGAVRDFIDEGIQKIKGFFDTVKKIKDDVIGWFDEMKNKIDEKINKAREAVSSAIDKIKGLFNFNFEWPKLKMPTFSIEGSMNPLRWLQEGVPKLKVNWNAQGGIFDQPTIFNTRAGLQGVGEAGAEAIIPISKLQEMVDWNSDRDLLTKILKVLEIMASKSTEILLDGDKLIGGTYERMDELSGFRSREQIIAYGG